MAESQSFIFTLSLVSLITIFFVFKIELWKERLKKKDKLIEALVCCLPKLSGEDINFRVDVRPEYDSKYLKVDIECDSDEFVDRFYHYIHSLHKKGYKASVNNRTQWKKTKTLT